MFFSSDEQEHRIDERERESFKKWELWVERERIVAPLFHIVLTSMITATPRESDDPTSLLVHRESV